LRISSPTTPWSLSFRETRCRSPPGFCAGAHPPLPYLWKRTSDCPLLHRGCPTKAPGDSERTSGTRARNFTRGTLPGLRSDLDRTARPIATPLPPPTAPLNIRKASQPQQTNGNGIQTSSSNLSTSFLSPHPPTNRGQPAPSLSLKIPTRRAGQNLGNQS
jgi:hypothetical protein